MLKLFVKYKYIFLSISFLEIVQFFEFQCKILNYKSITKHHHVKEIRLNPIKFQNLLEKLKKK